ncbi:MAG: NUDIX hydrolase [Patescibacteria group bacterium]
MGTQPPYRESRIPKDAKKVFEGIIFDIYQWQQKLFDGSYATFEMAHRADSAIVFPILPDGRILLIEDSQPNRETVITAPCGRVEAGETPDEAARRELKEETGYQAETLTLFYTDAPATKTDAVVYVYIGKGCTKVSEVTLDPGERITPRTVTFDELIAFATTGFEGQYYRGLPFRLRVYEALSNPQKMEELRKAFTP